MGANQCVILHVGAAMAWNIRGRGKSVPTRGCIYHQATATRVEGETQAKADKTSVGNHQSAQEHVLTSHVHDAMGTAHGRDSRRIFFTLWK